jgi:regulatory protein
MRITGLHSQRRHTGRANVHVDGTFHCGVAWEIVYSHGLRVGDEVSAELLDELRFADECWKAKAAALSLLATRARARNELVERLRRKGYGAAAVDHALAEVDRLGLVDDRAFAEAWIRDRLRARPRGSRMLLAELARKGVATDVARHAVACVMNAENTDDAELCRKSSEKWLRTRSGRAPAGDAEQRRREERRLAAFLMRRGYGAADIHAALRDSRQD